MKIEMEWITCLAFMAICAATDIRKKEIPIIIITLFGSFAFLYAVIWGGKGWGEILCSLAPGLFLLLLAFCTKESIGYGDGLAAVIVGVLIGWKECVTVIISGFLLSSVFVLILLVCRKVRGKSRIPFLPFLAIGMGVLYIAKKGM